ncbi:MAG: hypothetical protein ACKPKO_51645, partial [Candidatus Fonsibacter sp.]
MVSSITATGSTTSSIGTIIDRSLVITGTTVKPAMPTIVGVYIGLDSGNTAGGMEICVSYLPYIGFTAPTVDYKGSILYDHSAIELIIFVAGSLTANMTLNSSGLSVGGTFVSAIDYIFKFNEKPLTNALDV